jgi:CBS domain containing-hemolysin-like protein
MKQKTFKEKYSKKVSKKPVKDKKLVDTKWIAIISTVTFIITLIFSFIGETIIPNAYIVISFFLLIFFIFLGIIFDIIGVSITVADIKTFNSMASKKVKGASLAVKFIRNANKASSFFNDVIGDICGIVSGSTGITIAIIISERLGINLLIITLLMTSIISTITIGGKAIGKTIAINKSDKILYSFVKILSIFYKE